MSGMKFTSLLLGAVLLAGFPYFNMNLLRKS